jgi:hypothetical protein
MDGSWWPLSWLRGTYVPPSVVDVDTAARTAQGLVMGASTRVTIRLTEDQAQEAGLQHGGAYQVCRMLLDIEGEPVELPWINSPTAPCTGCTR